MLGRVREVGRRLHGILPANSGPPIYVSVGLVLIAILIRLMASQKNWGTYFGIHATASAAVLAVTIAVWLEWKKDLAAQTERRVQSAILAANLREQIKKLLKVLNRKMAGLDTPYRGASKEPLSTEDDLAGRLRTWSSSPNENLMEEFIFLSDRFHQLPSESALAASELFILFKSYIDLEKEARDVGYKKPGTEDQLHYTHHRVVTYVRMMVSHIEKLVRLLDEDLASHMTHSNTTKP